MRGALLLVVGALLLAGCFEVDHLWDCVSGGSGPDDGPNMTRADAQRLQLADELDRILQGEHEGFALSPAESRKLSTWEVPGATPAEGFFRVLRYEDAFVSCRVGVP